ncbi:IclR family transcriptional regulator [Bradyrhizobium sp. SYSU BS000235]|uniref:IclR family transcriptional regulator n=1 Tax=Bradyrhizobium sp. SYSU BS000235 TaxID=3411332 RepID=UPI003C789C4C
MGSEKQLPRRAYERAVVERPGVPIVRALDRGVALLRAFDVSKPRQTLTELAKRTGLDKGTARRLLDTLERAGLIDYDDLSSLYCLGIGVLELASSVETGRDLREVAAPYMRELTEQTGTTAYLWVYHEGHALCVERVRASIPNVDAAWFTVGSRAPLNSGGGPRALLGFVSPEELKYALSLELIKRTAKSQINPKLLAREAAHIRQRGWELAVDDFVVGLAALGAPIFDRKGQLVGSLSMTTLTAQLVQNGKPRFLDRLLKATAEVGSKMFSRT